MRKAFGILFLLFLVCPGAQAQEERRATDPGPGNWPQWRGPNRDNISKETGLLKVWPEGGPPLFWEVHGIGGGIAAVTVSGGRVFTVGYIGDSEYLTALDEKTGRRLWVARIGPVVQENPLMRWLGQRSPTVDGDQVFAFHSQGLLISVDASTGKELWRKDYVKDFGTSPHYWGICDRPLVDGNRLIVTPGGKVASMAALKKTTGELLWKSESRGNAAHAATILSTAAGVRQYVTCLAGKVVSFRASDGKHLWTHENFGRTANSCTPIAVANDIVATAGYGVGLALFKISASGDDVKAEPQYTQRVDISPFQDSALVIGSNLYVVGGGARSCVELSTGNVVWSDRTTGRGLASMTFADSHLYVHHSDGTLALVEATSEKFSAKSTFRVTPWQQASGATNPVVAGGRLYVRNENHLLSYDVLESSSKVDRPRPKTIVLDPPGGKAGPAAEAIYVPTPRDVVEKMLETAGVGEGDVLVDLGSGDGRILVGAASKCAKAIGYEIDPQLVRESRANIEKAGMPDLASVRDEDLFKADLSGATVVALYLPEKFLERLLPQLEKLKAGSRIVSHQFKIPGYAPEKELRVESKEDGDTHAIYLWTTPLKRAEK